MNEKKECVDYFLLLRRDCSDDKLLSNEETLENILRGIPPIIGMSKLGEPIITKASNNPGLEGYMPIDASNITISTYKDNPRFVACVHSDHKFNIKAVIDYLRREFHCGDIKFLSFNESDFIGEGNMRDNTEGVK